MWGKKKGSKQVHQSNKEVTKITRKTKIKETIEIPIKKVNQQVNVPVQTFQSYQSAPPRQKVLFEQEHYAESQRPLSNMPVQYNPVMAMPEQSGLRRKISSSSSSNSPRKHHHNMGGNIVSAQVVGQPSPYDRNFYNSIGPGTKGYDSTLGTGVPLGKNLYGQTGYASRVYTLQQPFPGQTVYLQQSPQRISHKTKSKFQRSLHPQYEYNQQLRRRQNAYNTGTLTGGNNQYTLNRESQNQYMNPQSQWKALQSKTQRMQIPTQTIVDRDSYNISQRNTLQQQQRVNTNPVQTSVIQNTPVPMQTTSTLHQGHGGKNQTVIKQTTKIKQNYTVPLQNTNRMSTNVPNLGTSNTLNSQLLGQQYGQSQVYEGGVQNVNKQQKIQNKSTIHNGKGKNQTTIKQKTKIKQTYTVPVQNVQQVVTVPTKVSTVTVPNLPTTNSLNNRMMLGQQYGQAQVYDRNASLLNTQVQPTSSVIHDRDVKKGKNQTVITEKTKIKEKYTVPIENVNQSYSGLNTYQTLNTQNQNMYGSGLNKTNNLQYIQQRYGQNQYQGGGNVAVTGMQQSNLNRKRSRSSSSSSDRNKRMNLVSPTNRVNVQTINQPNLLQSNYGQTGHIQTGYDNANMYTSQTDRLYTGVPLGKNLYGQTGYASRAYTIQQPFPGQTVYIEESPEKISNRTKERFSRTLL